MPFHVYVFERFDPPRGRGNTGLPYYFTNLSGEQLSERIVGPWNRGSSMTWGGRTADSRRTLNITVFETEDPIPREAQGSDAYRLMEAGEDVTDEWIVGPAGEVPAAIGREPAIDAPDPRRVMVVHGRNAAARDAMVQFLRCLDLDPIEWEDAVEATGEASPHNLTVVRAALGMAQAVVVVLTAEDRASLLPQLAAEGSPEILLEGQPRQNVTLEAGMAMAMSPERTVLVQLGHIRGASDFDGLNAVRLTNEAATRGRLRRRLRQAGCAVDDTGEDWLTPGPGGDFDAAVATPPNEHPSPPGAGAVDESASVDRLAIARLRLGTELRDIRHRLEIVRGTRPHPHYSQDFALPTSAWTEYGGLLAASPELYRAVEPAYVAVDHLHVVLEMRRSRADSPTRTLGVIAEDGLDEVYDAAGAALDALGEERGEVWQNAVDRAVAGVVTDLASDAPSDIERVLASKWAQAVLSSYRDIMRQGEELLKQISDWSPGEVLAPDLHERISRWTLRCLAWANETHSPLSAQQRQAFLGPPLGPLPPNQLADIVNRNLDALRDVRDLIEP